MTNYFGYIMYNQVIGMGGCYFLWYFTMGINSTDLLDLNIMFFRILRDCLIAY